MAKNILIAVLALIIIIGGFYFAKQGSFKKESDTFINVNVGDGKDAAPLKKSGSVLTPPALPNY